MKILSKLIFTFLICGGCACVGQTRVEFFAVGASSQEGIHFNIPLSNGQCYLGKYEKAKFDDNGSIQLNLKISAPGIIYFLNPMAKDELVEVYVEPNKHLKIYLGPEINFEGQLSEENSLLQFFRRKQPNRRLESNFKKSESPAAFLDSLNRRIESDIEYLESHRSKIRSSQYLTFVRNNIKIYYYNIAIDILHQGKFVEYCYRTRSRNDSIVTSDWGRLWKSLLHDELLNSGAINTCWFSEYLFNYIVSYRYFFLKEYSETGKDKAEFLRSIDILAKHYLSTANQSIFYPDFIYKHISTGIGFYIPEMVSAFNRFKSEITSSPTIELLEPKMREIEKYCSADLVSGTLDKVQFIEQAASVNSVEGLLKRFRSKVVLIDLWATWCGPCIEEFDHNDRIIGLQRQREDFIILYVSLDKTIHQVRWRQFIEKKGLEGFHLIASPALVEDLRAKLNYQSIPRYALVDKGGKLTNINAPPPSNEALFNMIQEQFDQ
jgi:thiol-disulfide isomerase/thioredoxin